MFATLIAVGFGWFGGGTQVADASRLRASGLQTKGVITSVTAGDMLNNSSAHYKFDVGGKTVNAYSNVLAKDEHRLSPGLVVSVTYMPENPRDSCLDPNGLVDSARRTLLIAGLLELVCAAIFIPLIIFSGTASPQGVKFTGENVAAVVVFSIMALAGLGALFFAAIPGLMRAEALVSEGKSVQATITGVWDGENRHGRYATYSYKVGDEYYHGKADYVGGYGDRGQITVKYLPSDPSYSAINPEAQIGGARGAIAFMLVWLSIIVVFWLVFRYGARRLRHKI